MKERPERLLTKSLFVRALNCPGKLFYAGKPEYADNSLGDEFLEALAKGGIQVGALARCYFPEGILVDAPDNQTALAQTTELLRRDRVVLFEAAIRHGSCLIRADILVKDGSAIELIEVKAKSYDSDSSAGFIQKRGGRGAGISCCQDQHWKGCCDFSGRLDEHPELIALPPERA